MTLVAYKRPYYLEQSLNTIVRNFYKPRNLKLIIGLEPSLLDSDNMQIIRKTLHNVIDFEIIKNKQVLGAQANKLQILRRAFSFDPDYNIDMEEDIILGTDALFLAEWYFHQMIENSICLNFLFGACGGHRNISVNRNNILATTKFFNSIGIVLTPPQFVKYFEPTWYNSNHRFKKPGWDWAIYGNNLGDDRDLCVIQPLLARANHIGRLEGTFATPEFVDRTFAHLEVSHNDRELEFKVLDYDSEELKTYLR